MLRSVVKSTIIIIIIIVPLHSCRRPIIRTQFICSKACKNIRNAKNICMKTDRILQNVVKPYQFPLTVPLLRQLVHASESGCLFLITKLFRVGFMVEEMPGTGTRFFLRLSPVNIIPLFDTYSFIRDWRCAG